MLMLVIDRKWSMLHTCQEKRRRSRKNCDVWRLLFLPI